MIKIYTQATHLKVSYDEATPKEIANSEEILKSKFQARDSSMARNPLVQKGIISDVKNFYNEEHKILPVGFLPFLETYYDKAKFKYTIMDARRFPQTDKDFLKDYMQGKIKFGPELPRDYQIEAVYEAIRNKGGIIQLPTASGKTLVMSALIRAYGKAKIMVFFNSIDLIEQTYEKMMNYGFKASEVGVIQGSNFDDTKRITLLSVQSYEKAYNLFTEVKAIICDEVHETGRTDVPEKIIYSCQNAPLHIGLSATPWSDNDYETMRLYGNIGPIIYKKEFKEQMDAEHLAKTEVEIYKYDAEPIHPIGIWPDIYETKKVNQANTPAKLKKEGFEIKTEKGEQVGKKLIGRGDEYTHIVNNERRNKKIVEVIKKYVAQNKRILVIYSRIEHGEILKKMYPKAILIHGEHSTEERGKAEKLLRAEEATVVLASTIWKKGIDIEQIDVYINATGGKGTVNVIQKLGRVVRKSRTTNKQMAIAVDFDDTYVSGIGRRQTEKRLHSYQKILNLPVRFI